MHFDYKMEKRVLICDVCQLSEFCVYKLLSFIYSSNHSRPEDQLSTGFISPKITTQAEAMICSFKPSVLEVQIV